MIHVYTIFTKFLYILENCRREVGISYFLPRGGRLRVNGNGSNRPPVPRVESSPFRNWVEWTWVDLEKCQVQGRQRIDFDPSPFDLSQFDLVIRPKGST